MKRRESLSHLPSSVAVAALAAFLLLALTSTAHADERLRVRADSDFVNVGVVRDATWAELSGVLRDDSGQPIADAEIFVPILEGDRVEPCKAGDRVRAGSLAKTAIAQTDEIGYFCLRVPAARVPEGSDLGYAGDAYHVAARAVVPAETGKRHLRLDFEKAKLIASLDSASFIVSVSSQVVESGNQGGPVRLVLFLATATGAPPATPHETELGATDITAGGTARFDLDTRSLGAPGLAKLVVRFSGSAGFAPTSKAVPLERRAVARISLPAAPAPADPTDGVELLVGVGSVVGAVSGGWVEALVHGTPVGTSPVSSGAARVAASFATARGRNVSVTLRYVAPEAGWIAGDPLTIEVPIKPPSPWRGTPWLLAAAGVAYWVVRSWRRPERSAAARQPSQQRAEGGRAAVELLEADLARTGWKGRITDAHDGTPVAGARVSIVVPVFDGEGVAASHITGADGSFTIAHVEAARNEGSRLVVGARFHATLSVSAPRDGLLAIALVSRRRALLDRFVDWAARAGHGRAARRPDPTPLELARLAEKRRDRELAAWAVAVADAAYGAVPPDERREGEIDALEPPVPGLSEER